MKIDENLSKIYEKISKINNKSHPLLSTVSHLGANYSKLSMTSCTAPQKHDGHPVASKISMTSCTAPQKHDGHPVASSRSRNAHKCPRMPAATVKLLRNPLQYIRKMNMEVYINTDFD